MMSQRRHFCCSTGRSQKHGKLGRFRLRVRRTTLSLSPPQPRHPEPPTTVTAPTPSRHWCTTPRIHLMALACVGAFELVLFSTPKFVQKSDLSTIVADRHLACRGCKVVCWLTSFFQRHPQCNVRGNSMPHSLTNNSWTSKACSAIRGIPGVRKCVCRCTFVL